VRLSTYEVLLKDLKFDKFNHAVWFSNGLEVSILRSSKRQYWISAYDYTKKKRTSWFDIDALTAQCILYELTVTPEGNSK
jgi:hypothetical protein